MVAIRIAMLLIILYLAFSHESCTQSTSGVLVINMNDRYNLSGNGEYIDWAVQNALDSLNKSMYAEGNLIFENGEYLLGDSTSISSNKPWNLTFTDTTKN